MNKPKTNTLIAYFNIIEHDSSKLPPITSKKGGNANKQGDPFEIFIKDMLCIKATQYPYIEDKQEIYKEFLSWTGNSINFPDAIIRYGEGIEPKKLQTFANLSLNSSFPKSYLYKDTQNLSNKIDEPNWDKKNLVYAVCCVPTKINSYSNENNQCSEIWLVFANTFVADKKVYMDVINGIKNGAKDTNPNANFQTTKELGRIKGIDPEKHTNLRLRGMWELDNPHNIFKNYLTESFSNEKTKVYLVVKNDELEILKDQFEEITKRSYKVIEDNENIKINEVKLPDPNGEGNIINATIFEGKTN